MNSTRFIDESKVCYLCEEALSVADIDLMSSWLLELTRYEANFFNMFCRKCFDKTYPGYLNSKMTLRQIKEWGRIFDVEEAIIWLNAGFEAVHASHWFELLLEDDGLVDIEVAKEWRQVGFTSENYEEWSGWSKNPKEIATTLKINGETIDNIVAPELGFRDLGFNLSEAIKLSEAGFETDATNCWPKDCIDNWMTGGLNVEELIALKLEVAEKNDVFEEKHNQCYANIKDWEPSFATHLPKVLNALRELGLPIIITNILNYWGLSKAQILKAIDMGADVDFASNMVRNGISATKARVVERLMSKEIKEDSAIELTKRGFSLNTFEKIDESGYSFNDFSELVSKLKPLKVDEVLKWFLVDVGSRVDVGNLAPFWLRRVPDWYRCGFTPDSAVEWYREGFFAEDANAWVKSGAKSPAVAKRRKAAGISPKAVS